MRRRFAAVMKQTAWLGRFARLSLFFAPLVAGAQLGACTFLVEFEERAEAGAGLDGSFEDDAPVTLPDTGAVVPTDARPPETGPGGNPCLGQPQGFNYQPGDPAARCCSGQPVRTDTNDNCGACGLSCNVGAQHQCTAAAGHYYCLGCNLAAGGGNGGCWSNCCSITYFGQGACAPNTCSNGQCDQSKCTQFGATCQVVGDASNICGY